MGAQSSLGLLSLARTNDLYLSSLDLDKHSVKRIRMQGVVKRLILVERLQIKAYLHRYVYRRTQRERYGDGDVSARRIFKTINADRHSSSSALPSPPQPACGNKKG